MVKLIISRIRCTTFTSLRCFSAKSKVVLDETISSLLISENLKHRNHPGVIKPRVPTFPQWALTKISHILKEEAVSKAQIKESAEMLLNHLHARQLPIEEKLLHNKLLKIEDCLNADKSKTQINIEDVDFNTNKKAKILLKKHVYNWQPINFDRLTTLTYMVARVVQNYAVIRRILDEIKTRDKDFKPYTLFDFGSGLGTVTWAVSEVWPNSMKEYLCIEISKSMIELSEKLAKAATPKIKNIFHREYLPASNYPTYDIVVSAFSLFELPGTEARLETILKLWQKTEHYLIIVEQGTNEGYKVVNEARDLILKYTKSKYRREPQSAYVLAPCPHDLKCPRFNDTTPCNFEVLYNPLPLAYKGEHKAERYSYVVLKKDKRPEDDEQWPRIVRAALHRGKHTICRMCVANGELKEEIFTKYKNGRDIYRCARKSEWGDRLPIYFEEQENILNGNDTTNEETAVE